MFELPAPNERALRSLSRLRERFKLNALSPAIEAIAASEFGILDIYMNLNRQFADGELGESTKLMVGVAVATACGSGAALEFFAEAAVAAGRTRAEVSDAIALAGTQSVFNGYYRFRHQIPEDEEADFVTYRATFSANASLKSPLPVVEREAIALAVSSVNDCQSCVRQHLGEARAATLTTGQIDETIRAAAIAQALSRVTSAMGGAGLAIAVG